MTSWADRSAAPVFKGATAVSVAGRPLRVASALGDRPTLRFDGQDNALKLAPGLADLRRSGVTVAALVRSTAGRRSSPLVSLGAAAGAGAVQIRCIAFGPDALLVVDKGAISGPVGLEALDPILVLATVGPDGHGTLAQGSVLAAQGPVPRPGGLLRDASRIGRDAKGLRATSPRSSCGTAC